MIDIEKLLAVNTYITAGELKELEKLSTDYPWFSIIHQLVLIGSVQNSCELTAKTRQAAIYTLNHKRLYSFLKKAAQYGAPDKKTDKHEVTKENTIKSEPTIDTINDDLLLSFSNEYFSVEDIPPIDVSGQDDESNDLLISKFITENPRIVPKSSSISDLGNLIQIDEDFEDEPASETLAEIYVSQGLYEQAISTYEKLSLLNPEKSIYFASLINELREKLK